ncbi:hypothetical protein TYRP_023208 [Tyrophagus putrescentiae]|nr:hypothetical protein TYRP_023208 [Tyrophagus putrescentiae]
MIANVSLGTPSGNCMRREYATKLHVLASWIGGDGDVISSIGNIPNELGHNWVQTILMRQLRSTRVCAITCEQVDEQRATLKCQAGENLRGANWAQLKWVANEHHSLNACEMQWEEKLNKLSLSALVNDQR